MEDEPIFKTNNLPLAAFIFFKAPELALPSVPTGRETLSGNRIKTFCFRDFAKCQDIKEDWDLLRAKVNKL